MGHFAGEFYNVKHARVIRDHGLGHFGFFERGEHAVFAGCCPTRARRLERGLGTIHPECSIFSELALRQRCMMYSPPARDMKKILEDIMNVKLYNLRILLTFDADRILVTVR